MTLWAYIPAASIVRVGELPASATRLDTGAEVFDLAGTGGQWRRACGWWDLDSPTFLADLRAAKTLTAAQVAAITSAAQTARSRRDGRATWRGEVEQAVAARGVLWDWIDDYASRPVVGSQTAGANWPAGSTNLALLGQTDALQAGMTELMVAVIEISEALGVILPLLADLIAAADAVTAPPPR